MHESPVPVEGCWVKRRRIPHHGKPPLGQVLGRHIEDASATLEVRWGSGRTEWVDMRELRSGYQLGWAVQDVPVSATRRPLGTGRVVGRRELGGRDQILVQLDGDGRSVWLPYENLRRIKDVKMRHMRAETGVPDHAERLRLKLLAHALENWNHLTGSLDRLDVDPLPHQIQLVHRIINSGNYNWLIADDVGLGKTIEVGLLLAALKRKGQARRVLIVCPSSLVRQWRDELHYKFAQDAFIYGDDFNINKAENWRMYDRVIVSMDLAKRENHMHKFSQADSWDIVVFDEGHKLTRYSSGERADRYKLAEMLRPMADSFILLSGTPHQGYTDRFVAILELVRPDLRARIRTIEANPEIVSEMILRNRKNEVTDADGELIFKGQVVHRVPISPSDGTKHFQHLLDNYLRNGYRAGEEKGAAGRAIGFVMTTYRKLSSSSVAAIERALRLRLQRLSQEGTGDGGQLSETNDLTADDLAEGGDNQDDLASGGTFRQEFFAHEREMIKELLGYAVQVRQNDEKLAVFMRKVVAPLVKQGKKLLVFTEYRATQDYLREYLEDNFFGQGEISLINGSMTLNEKLESIESFNLSAPFMISTEAGGEGINLHEACHVMVNYDLPWNPARLIQRIGRLYRYGQKNTVIVFNLHALDSFDNKIIDVAMQRVNDIARAMSPVGEEYDERFYTDVLGDMLDNFDLAEILKSATSMRIDRTTEQVETALRHAMDAKRLQDEIFAHVTGYDPNALGGTIGFTMQHVDAFVRGMLPIIGIEYEGNLYAGAVHEVRLPEHLREQFPEFGRRTVVRITTDRRIAQRSRAVLLDFESPFFQYLIDQAKLQSFDGLYGATRCAVAASGLLLAFILRWQNDQGESLTEEFIPLFATGDGQIDDNPKFLAEWLLSPAESTPPPDPSEEDRRGGYDRLVSEANHRLKMESTRFKHPNGLVEIAALDCRPRG